jgi:Raf kinase inhibitor-like YbhB/YbcL family protein
MAFKLRSPAFGPGGDIPVRHASDGSDVSPPLRWTDPPDGTKSFALTVAALDSTSGLSVHWLLYGIPATVRELPEGIPRQDAVPGIGSQGLNDLGVVGYSGPCPPPGPAHRYAFTLYALDTLVSLLPRKTRADLRKAMYGHVVVRVKLIGRTATALRFGGRSV